MKKIIMAMLASLLTLTLALPASASRPSVNDTVTLGNLNPPDRSATNSMTRDGRLMVFTNDFPYLVPNDTNENADVFIYDRVTKKFERINLGPNGEQANNISLRPTISGDGRYVAYGTWATNLAADVPCPNPIPPEKRCSHILVYDRTTKKTVTANVDANGKLMDVNVSPNNEPYTIVISADGNHLAFTAVINPNHHTDTVVRDLRTGINTVVSLDTNGNPASNAQDASAESISGDGKRVVFTTSSRLVPADADDAIDVYLRDTAAAKTTLISQTYKANSAGRFDHFPSDTPAISENGQFVVFQSANSDIVPNDQNKTIDIFVRDLAANKTQRVSVARSGGDTNSISFFPSINADGSLITYNSLASNIVRFDPPSKIPFDPADSDIFVYYRRYDVTRRLIPPTNPFSGIVMGASKSAISADGRAINYQASPNEEFNPVYTYVYYDPFANIPFYDSNDFINLL